MATIEYYREREAQSAADAAAATSDQVRFAAPRSEGVWRRLADLGEKREGRIVPVTPVPAAKPKRKVKVHDGAKPTAAKAA